ncbi:MAG: hypothetical protein LVR00_06140 [Rhabdochlamydiaceae bacterium]
MIKAQVQTALKAADYIQGDYVIQGLSSFAFPSIFQVLIGGIGCQIAKKIPELDLKTTFPSLLRTSIGLTWQLSYFIQNFMNNSTYLRLALEKIGTFEISLLKTKQTSP